MNTSRLLRLFGCIALLALSANAAPGQDKKASGKGIDAAVVAVYQKLGATYGGFQEDHELGLWFEAGQEAANQGLPGFRFHTHPKAKLPDAGVPFGLHFGHSRTLTDAALKELAGLKNLTALSLYSTEVTSVGLKELVGLTNLSELDLYATKVGNTGTMYLAELPKLSTLSLNWTKVTDVGLKDLSKHQEISTLRLGNTGVTDAGLKELAGLKKLASLDLTATEITDAGLRELLPLKELSAA